MFLTTSWRIVYRAVNKWTENGDARMGAALSYYALFSSAPLLLIAVHIAGIVFGDDAARGNVQEQLNSLMGKEIASTVEKMVSNAAESSDKSWTPLISILLLVVGALGALLQARGSLCIIWKLEPPSGNTVISFLLDYVFAIFLVFIIAALLLFSIACSLAIPILQKTVTGYYLIEERYWQWLEMLVSFGFLTLLFAASYRTLSGGRISWSYVWYGSLIASILFTIGKTLLSYYLVYSGTASMYGAAGSVVVFLIWVYYSSQILFFGAELVQARRTRHEWMNAQNRPA